MLWKCHYVGHRYIKYNDTVQYGKSLWMIFLNYKQIVTNINEQLIIKKKNYTNVYTTMVMRIQHA